MRSLTLALLLVCVSAVAQEISTVQSDKVQKPSIAESQIDEKALIGSSVDAASKIAISEGWAALKRGDSETAIKLFNRAAGMIPNSADAYWGLGAATAQQGKFDVSIHSFDRARKLDPKNPRLAADAGLSYTYFAMSQPESSDARKKGLSDALVRFDEAVKLDPDYALTYANRAIALTYSGDYDGAWKSVEKAESLDKASVNPRLISYLSGKQPRPAPKPLAQAAAEPATRAASPVDPTAEAKPQAPPAQPMIDAKPVVAAKPAQSETAAPVQSGQQASISAALAAAAAVTGKPAPQPEIKQVALQENQAESAAAPKSGLKPEEENEQEPETGPEEEAAQKPEPVQATEPAPEKKLKVISGTPARQKGADKRQCLDLPTNEEIIRCVYPRR